VATVPVQITWVTGSIVTAAQLNANVRDAVNFAISPPLFVGRQTIVQSVPNSFTTGLTLDVEDVDRDGGHSTVTNTSRYTSQTQGWYSGQASVIYDVLASAAFRLIGWRINGAGAGFGWAGNVATASTISHATTAGRFFLNVGDYVEPVLFTGSGPINTQVTTWGNPRCSIEWVST
jgi:hypothetical protein